MLMPTSPLSVVLSHLLAEPRPDPNRTSTRIVILFPNGRRWWEKEPGGDLKEILMFGVEPPSSSGWTT
jgi:hypothetical protein